MKPVFDFGYSWIWTSGHLVPAALFGLLALTGWRLHWSRWKVFGCVVLAFWALAGYAIVHGWITSPQALPTERFFVNRDGKVLDIGAGSGRTTLMVLQARPKASVVALDLFSGYYGIDGNSPERLKANVRAAGMESRLEVQTGDMRKMPLADASVEGAVSSYAIDHLNRDGIAQALRETRRVLKPGGEFLLMVINRDNWIRVAYPIFPHGYYSQSRPTFWNDAVKSAGLEVVEQGTSPGTLYVLARKGE